MHTVYACSLGTFMHEVSKNGANINNREVRFLYLVPEPVFLWASENVVQIVALSF